jgi:hypothetical protein
VQEVRQKVGKIQEQIQEEVTHIREVAEAQVGVAETKAESRCRALLEQAMEQLEPLQKDLLREGELGKALAVAVQIQALRGQAQDVLPDPGNLLGSAQIGKTSHFRVIGATDGPVWGTDVYTADSHLASAAVHAGAVEAGEEGVVRVSIVDMSAVPVHGSLHNGVQSMDWGPYAVGYRVKRAELPLDTSTAPLEEP